MSPRESFAFPGPLLPARGDVHQLRLAADDAQSLAASECNETPPARPAPANYDRKNYAPPPIGYVEPAVPPPPAAPPPPAPIENQPHVTNLGTLLDVLA